MVEVNYENPIVTEVITHQSLSITVTVNEKDIDVDEKEIEIIISSDDRNEAGTQVISMVQVTCGEENGFSEYDGYLEMIQEYLIKLGEKTKEEIDKICDEIDEKVEKILDECDINV